MSAQEFRLPDVGEGLEEAEIVRWCVAAGDTVAHNQVLVEIETAKSLVELPSPYEGVVTELLVAEGEIVTVGTPIIGIGGEGSATPAASTPPPVAETETAEPAPKVLVGYGVSDSNRTRRRRRAPADTTSANGTVPTAPALTLAKPPVRKLAKDLGVDLATVVVSRPDGVLTREDVRRHTAPAPVADPPAPVVTAAGEGETRIPIKGVRKATAAAMVSSAFAAPHVTEFLTVDVTRSVKLVEKLKGDKTFESCRVTTLLLIARALVATIRQYPDINASWDDASQEIVLHREVNLGIAAATPRGLMVPNIKNAGALTLSQLSAALTELVGTARAGRSTPEDMTRGTITITNIGVFGVDAGTPILNPGEAAILCVGAIRRTPWEYKGRVALRWTTQLALSFDHRLVDGELGSKVLARVGRILENPKWELLLS